MHRVVSIAFAALVFVSPPALAGADYTLTLDGKTYDLELGSEQKLKLKGGQEFTLKVERKTTSIFSEDGVTFEHPSQFNVARSDLGDGIHQYLMATALGTLVLVQTYENLQASTLTEFMMGKMTDDDVASGSTRDSKPHSITLSDGTVVSGLRATLKRTSDDAVVEVIGVNKGRGGIMLITRTDRHTAPNEGGIIEGFWRTLKLEK